MDKLEKIIRNKLEQTRHCKSKNAVVECLFGKGYAFVNIKKFSKELAKELKETR